MKKYSKKQSLLLCSIFSLSMYLSGCFSKSNGSSTGNPMVTLSVTGSSSSTISYYKSLKQNLWNLFFPIAQALNAPNSMTDLSGHTVTLSQFWINFDNIEFEPTQYPQSDEVDGNNVSLAGPFTIDLLSNNPTVFGPLPVNASSFQRLKFKTEVYTNGTTSAPSALQNNSIYLLGTVSGSNFTVLISDQSEIEIGGPKSVSPNSNSRLLLQISTISIFAKIDLSSLVGSTTSISTTNKVSATNPCPSIDSSASDLYTCFVSSLAKESNIGEDVNQDFQIDNNEPSIK